MYTGNKKTEEKVASKLPQPQGYKILIGVPETSEKTEGGVIMPDGMRSAEETASIIGFVFVFWHSIQGLWERVSFNQ
jgi:hypothetical protein